MIIKKFFNLFKNSKKRDIEILEYNLETCRKYLLILMRYFYKDHTYIIDKDHEIHNVIKSLSIYVKRIVELNKRKFNIEKFDDSIYRKGRYLSIYCKIYRKKFIIIFLAKLLQEYDNLVIIDSKNIDSIVEKKIQIIYNFLSVMKNESAIIRVTFNRAN